MKGGLDEVSLPNFVAAAEGAVERSGAALVPRLPAVERLSATTAPSDATNIADHRNHNARWRAGLLISLRLFTGQKPLTAEGAENADTQ